MRDGLPDDHVRQAGLDPFNPAIRQAVHLADELIGFPRHLSQHVGGFVLTREPLDETVPIGDAAMEDRTFIEWDKDDIDTLGLMKVDVLALGMLSCLRRGLDLLQQRYGKSYSLATLPQDDPAVYEMLSRADSVGVFQVESRAQMSMLPRLKPRCFYDLVIEVAIVRPGPIQGDMVHPYLRRRDRIDPEHYPSPIRRTGRRTNWKTCSNARSACRCSRSRRCRSPSPQPSSRPTRPTDCGAPWRPSAQRQRPSVPRQVHQRHDRPRLRAGFRRKLFRPDRGLRRIRLSRKPRGELRASGLCLVLDQVPLSGRVLRRHPQQPADGLLSASAAGARRAARIMSRFARPTSISAIGIVRWSLPPPLYPPPQAGEGSGAPRDACVAGTPGEGHAVRLGFRLISGLSEDEFKKLIAARGNGFASIERLVAVAGVSRFTIERLAEADAFRSLGLDRRAALWSARRLDVIGIRTTRPKALAKKTLAKGFGERRNCEGQKRRR